MDSNERKRLLRHAYTPPRTVALSKDAQKRLIRYNNNVIIEALQGKRESYDRQVKNLKNEAWQMEMVSEWKNKRSIRVLVSYSRAHKHLVPIPARQEAISHARAQLGDGSWTLIQIISEVWRHYV